MKRTSLLTMTGMLALCLVLAGCPLHPTSVTVPNVVAQTQAAAFTTIIGAGLAVGAITQAYSTIVIPGSVVSQTPTPGALVSPGSAVDLTVSLGSQPATVPDVAGQTREEAYTAIVGAGLRVGTITRMYSSTVPSDSVISQSPAAGTSVNPGSPVALVLSQGPQPVTVTVPNVTGLPQTAAGATLLGAGLTVGTVAQAYSSTVPSGSVIGQSPAAGTSTSPGSAVALVVSQGPQPVIVPDVAGMTQVAADAVITHALLTVGAATQMYSATVASGSVISQNPTPGVLVNPGSAVALMVSQGPEPVPVPYVVGMTQVAADTVITNALLALGTVTQMYSLSVASGSVISQNPVAGVGVLPGTEVNLEVSRGPVFVPYVVGMTLPAANTVITNALLALGTITQVYSSTVAPGSVSSQSPVSGTPVSPGFAVALAVSVGPPATVPDVAGMTLTAAQTALAGARLTTGMITEGCSGTVPAVSVIGQTPAAGQQVTPGSAVALGVSTGETCDVAVEMLPVSAGTFTMGNSGVGDDAAYGKSDEFPPHPVTLSAYQIGKFEVTNQQYCDMLNWALAQGYLMTGAGADWAGAGDIYTGGELQVILGISNRECNVQYSGGVFSPKTRAGKPNNTNYSMDTHPVEEVSWYGAAAFCNWLSQTQGLTPCYDMTTDYWPLTVEPPTPGGYRLPTEAEWERAAAWDGSMHWIYGFTSDTLTGRTRCNWGRISPLGLAGTNGRIFYFPYTSPVGWFDGLNISPNGNVDTVNSVSPVGAYDMSGNAAEWCGDWWGGYGSAAQTNPTGADAPSELPRVCRGGGWDYSFDACRSACRGNSAPTTMNDDIGFRLARSVASE